MSSQENEQQRLFRLCPVLRLRDRLLQAIRAFFQARDFLEVHTPIRIKAPPPELHIDAEPAAERYLRTSPELHMKRLLAAGYDRLFQVGPCFRQGEQGRWHAPEYTMLEWYVVGADYLDILEQTKALIGYVAEQTQGSSTLQFEGQTISTSGVWEVMSVDEAFRHFAGWSPFEDFDADRFDLDLSEKVVPQLKKDVPVVLRDYPPLLAAMARSQHPPEGTPYAERWELYLGGLEIANAYTELTDRAEHQARFALWSVGREQLGKEQYPTDQPFLDALAAGLPACGGIALGIDRLLMVLSNRDSIDQVIPFFD